MSSRRQGRSIHLSLDRRRGRWERVTAPSAPIPCQGPQPNDWGPYRWKVDVIPFELERHPHPEAQRSRWCP